MLKSKRSALIMTILIYFLMAVGCCIGPGAAAGFVASVFTAANDFKGDFLNTVKPLYYVLGVYAAFIFNVMVAYFGGNGLKTAFGILAYPFKVKPTPTIAWQAAPVSASAFRLIGYFLTAMSYPTVLILVQKEIGDYFGEEMLSVLSFISITGSVIFNGKNLHNTVGDAIGARAAKCNGFAKTALKIEKLISDIQNMKSEALLRSFNSIGTAARQRIISEEQFTNLDQKLQRLAMITADQEELLSYSSTPRSGTPEDDANILSESSYKMNNPVSLSPGYPYSSEGLHPNSSQCLLQSDQATLMFSVALFDGATPKPEDNRKTHCSVIM